MNSPALDSQPLSILTRVALQPLPDNSSITQKESRAAVARDELGVGCVLPGDAIRAAIVSPKPLVREFRNIDSQVHPNGFDLTLASVARHGGSGSLGVSNADRQLPELDELAFDEDGWVSLEPGCFHIIYNEIVALPLTLMA